MNQNISEKQAPDDSLVDIRTIAVRKDLSKEERIAEFVRQIRNPYKVKCGDFVVQVKFASTGATLEDRLAGLIR